MFIAVAYIGNIPIRFVAGRVLYDGGYKARAATVYTITHTGGGGLCTRYHTNSRARTTI